MKVAFLSVSLGLKEINYQPRHDIYIFVLGPLRTQEKRKLAKIREELNLIFSQNYC